MDPATSLAAGAIAKIAFDEFVKSGAGEVAKKTVGAAIGDALALVKNLRDKIKAKFQGNERAEKALAEMEQQGTADCPTDYQYPEPEPLKSSVQKLRTRPN